MVPKLKQDMRAILTTNWKIWIPFQFLNFNFVPQQLQVCQQCLNWLAPVLLILVYETICSRLVRRESHRAAML